MGGGHDDTKHPSVHGTAPKRKNYGGQVSQWQPQPQLFCLGRKLNIHLTSSWAPEAVLLALSSLFSRAVLWDLGQAYLRLNFTSEEPSGWPPFATFEKWLCTLINVNFSYEKSVPLSSCFANPEPKEDGGVGLRDSQHSLPVPRGKCPWPPCTPCHNSPFSSTPGLNHGDMLKSSLGELESSEIPGPHQAN